MGKLDRIHLRLLGYTIYNLCASSPHYVWDGPNGMRSQFYYDSPEYAERSAFHHFHTGDNRYREPQRIK